MKNYFFSVLLIFTSTIIVAGNPSKDNNKAVTALVSGKVVDKTSGEEIAGAEINIDNKIVYSDLEGNFSTTININNTDAVVKYVSYNDTKVKLNPNTYNTIIIELPSK